MFIHHKWNIVNACVPRDLIHYDKQNASWALRCIQADLRHRIGRKEGTTHLDSRCTAKFEQVIPCDDGGWVKIDDLIKMEVLWTHHSRKISVNGDVRDAEQQRRIYNQRLQLLFNGNLLAARQRNVQFLGVRVKDPPEGPQRIGWVNSDMMVPRRDQITELQSNQYTQREQQYLSQCDGWVRPRAVRAVSGHSAHPDPEMNLVELDPDRFAISPSRTLMNELGGAYHATSCRRLRSIAERGILPGASIDVTYGSRHEAGRLHSYYGIFPPWDHRNTTTKTRVSGRSNWYMPLVVLYVPSTDLIRQGGRITDSGNIIVNRPVPFRFVKEVWFCVPEGNTEGKYEILEKIMDESLEDELVLDYKASPILDGYRRYRTPAHVMTILCEMQTGPHQAEKERLLRALAAAVDYPLNDDRREHYSGYLHDQAYSCWRPLRWKWK